MKLPFRHAALTDRRNFPAVGGIGRALKYVAVCLSITALALPGGPDTTLVSATTPTNGLAIASIQPTAGQVVGVAEPLTLRFAEPVIDRAAAERTLNITASNGQIGRIEWLNDQVLQWKPVGFWPSHTHITMMSGGFATDITTGAAVVGVASISQHTFTVSIDGQVARVMPASMGKPSRPTPIGDFTVLDRNRSVVMDSRTIGIPLSSSEGYLITASYAERITNSGVYVHSAPWSVDSQGHANVSHGCINLSPDNAAWYYDTVHVGDPVSVQA
jgi:lipoprotein-anchoring transpeptidase ErfK/SrfK